MGGCGAGLFRHPGVGRLRVVGFVQRADESGQFGELLEPGPGG
jgi:hypothetical protein